MNIWEHPQIMASEALRHLEDSLVVTKMCAKDITSEFSTKSNGWKKGDTVSFRTHGDYVAEDFVDSINVQDILTSSRSMMIEKHFDVSVEITAREMVLDLDSFTEQVIQPAAYRLAEKTEQYVAGKLLSGQGLYVSSALYESAADMAQARKYATMQQLGNERYSLVDLEAEATLLGQTWFNQSQTRGSDGERTLRSAKMGRVMGMDWYSAITFPQASHTAGNGTAVTNNSPTVNRIGMKELTFDGGAGAVNAGDRLAIAGCRRPVVAAEAVADMSLVTSIAIVDPITEIIPDDAAITVVGAGLTFDYQGAIFDGRSLAVAFPVLDMVGSEESGVASNNGVSVRVVRGYDLKTKKTTLSLDLLVGAFALDPRRITLAAKSQ